MSNEIDKLAAYWVKCQIELFKNYLNSLPIPNTESLEEEKPKDAKD